MDWISSIGRRLLIAYSEGLSMSCPHHLEECGTHARKSEPRAPGDIGMRADDVAVHIQHSSTVRH